jgi:hypothetical protein
VIEKIPQVRLRFPEIVRMGEPQPPSFVPDVADSTPVRAVTPRRPVVCRSCALIDSETTFRPLTVSLLLGVETAEFKIDEHILSMSSTQRPRSLIKSLPRRRGAREGVG